MEINRFRDEYDFLSNFYRVDIEYEGIIYPTVEHAFQALKTLDNDERLKISLLDTPTEAKRAGRKVTLRSDWEDVKLDIMKELIMIKFHDPILKEKLLNTKDAILIEGNTWNDYYWGECKGKGQNHLGKILMEVRDMIK
ncbi:MAG: NADAR family protein [Erysipelotrichaceae bacterium]|nr:NADAR family protein [Erysipelotrichaceae bacterium]